MRGSSKYHLESDSETPSQLMIETACVTRAPTLSQSRHSRDVLPFQNNTVVPVVWGLLLHTTMIHMSRPPTASPKEYSVYTRSQIVSRDLVCFWQHYRFFCECCGGARELWRRRHQKPSPGEFSHRSIIQKSTTRGYPPPPKNKKDIPPLNMNPTICTFDIHPRRENGSPRTDRLSKRACVVGPPQSRKPAPFGNH